ncbi:MAG: hypothetical protein ACI90V_002454, partial [Bacillariaceae sp.]|jgi:hypothetical protein
VIIIDVICDRLSAYRIHINYCCGLWNKVKTSMSNLYLQYVCRTLFITTHFNPDNNKSFFFCESFIVIFSHSLLSHKLFVAHLSDPQQTQHKIKLDQIQSQHLYKHVNYTHLKTSRHEDDLNYHDRHDLEH